MKKALLVLIAMMLTSGVSHATVGYQSNGTPVGAVTDVNTGAGLQGSSFDGSTLTLSAAAGAITSGTINGATIGASTPASGTFTNLTSTSNSIFTSIAISGAQTVDLISTATTLSAANIIRNAVFVPRVSGSYTVDTGANINALEPMAAVGTDIPFTISNPTAGTITLVGNTGSAVGAAWTVATLQSRIFHCIFIASNQFTIY